MNKFIASFSLKAKPSKKDQFICINSNREILLVSVSSSFLHDVNDKNLVDPIQIFTHGNNSIFLINLKILTRTTFSLRKRKSIHS